MASWYDAHIRGKEVKIAVGTAVAVGVIYGANHLYQKHMTEKYGPRNLRQLRKRYGRSRLFPRSERATYTEVGGQPLNTRQLARMR
jgi:hypothetical protein